MVQTRMVGEISRADRNESGFFRLIYGHGTRLPGLIVPNVGFVGYRENRLTLAVRPRPPQIIARVRALVLFAHRRW